MRIDADVNVFGSAPPPGAFHVTGLGTQFDESSPYLHDYQIMPRYIEDIDLINSTLEPFISSWIVTPNPTSSSSIFQTNVALTNVQVQDITGRTVGFCQHLGDRRNWLIDLSALSPGQYWIRAFGMTGETMTFPLIRVE
ncbi:MAG: T9SS type A sorting domain-containing protein [Saprospiraceae bacterium]|nr:T9SS type A sorting domain-containing protein [Saprospiraceae bacterium]